MKKFLVVVTLSALVFGSDQLYKPVNGKCKAGHEMITIKSMEWGDDCGHAFTTKDQHIYYGENPDSSFGTANDSDLLSYSMEKKKPICSKSKLKKGH